MEYSWNQLVDRCQLFVDNDRGILKGLLKEAEEELANKCMLYDAMYYLKPDDLGWTAVTTENKFWHNLPYNYLQDVAVWCNNTKLKKITESELNYKPNNIEYSSQTLVDSGTPTAYCISGQLIQFNTQPSSDDDIMLYYKASLNPNANDKILSGTPIGGGAMLVTSLREKLNGLNLFGNAGSSEVLNAISYENFDGPSTSPPLLNPATYGTFSSGRGGCWYTGTGAGFTNSTMFIVSNYRSVAPVIPTQYHLSLCDYAISISYAKIDQALYDKHYLLWQAGLEDIRNRDIDKDLVFSIEEVV